eukprot:3381396-Pyramimonas_sp.AAC.1
MSGRHFGAFPETSWTREYPYPLHLVLHFYVNSQTVQRDYFYNLFRMGDSKPFTSAGLTTWVRTHSMWLPGAITRALLSCYLKRAPLLMFRSAPKVCGFSTTPVPTGSNVASQLSVGIQSGVEIYTPILGLAIIDI